SPDLLATAPFSFHADVGIRSATVTGVQTCALPILEGALDAQRRFVADASHELRTPLATIQGNAGLLAMGPNVEEKVRRAAAADKIGRASCREGGETSVVRGRRGQGWQCDVTASRQT